jgi:hypothetical protein
VFDSRDLALERCLDSGHVWKFDGCSQETLSPIGLSDPSLSKASLTVPPMCKTCHMGKSAGSVALDGIYRVAWEYTPSESLYCGREEGDLRLNPGSDPLDSVFIDGDTWRSTSNRAFRHGRRLRRPLRRLRNL